MRVTVIGIGGIGSHLSEWTARLLSYIPGKHTLTLVDGDIFENKNRERQSFRRGGNKAEAKVAEFARDWQGLDLSAVSEYISPDNAEVIIFDGDVVLLAVDNHKTRKMVFDFCAGQKDVTLISGGNEDTFGTVLVYARREGRDLTPPLDFDRPEIANPKEPAPYELSCEERAAAGEPQIFAANLTAAVLMMNALYRLLTDPEGFVSRILGEGKFARETAYHEIYFDVILNMTRALRNSRWAKRDQGANPDRAAQEKEVPIGSHQGEVSEKRSGGNARRRALRDRKGARNPRHRVSRRGRAQVEGSGSS